MTDFDKTQPAGSTKVRLSDDQIRANNDALQDAISRDHKFPTSYGTDAGEHTRVKFTAPITTPTSAANKGFLYSKDVGAKAELHWEDEDSNEIQLTSAGKLMGNPVKVTPVTTPTSGANTGFFYGKDVAGKIEAHFLDEDGNEVQLTSAGALDVPPAAASPIPSGTKMWFYANSAPTGWTIDSTPSDEVLAVKGGGTYTAGGAGAGDWTHAHSQSHTHSFSGTPSVTVDAEAAHTHTLINSSSLVASGVDYYALNATTSAGSSHAHTASSSVSGTTGAASAATDANTTFRPKARVGIICSKDA